MKQNLVLWEINKTDKTDKEKERRHKCPKSSVNRGYHCRCYRAGERSIRKHCEQLYIYQFSRLVMSDSLWPHELQHARPPYPSPTPGVYPNSCPLSQWCHLTISSSVVPFSSCPQFFPASEFFQMSQLFTSGGQSTGVSALASFLPKKSQGWSPSEWTG